MERLLRLAQFWNWLPAFRAVAETQHLPRAAKALCTSAPALSRAVKLLERRLGKPLFKREGRRIVLNEDGERFLEAVRNAMRFVHEGHDRVTSREPVGPLHISAVGAAEALVLPALFDLRRTYPKLEILLHQQPCDTVNLQLLRGQLDLAFVHDVAPHERLQVEEIGFVASSVYCAKNHELASAQRLQLAGVLKHEFVAPVVSDGDFGAVEHWPPGQLRRIGLRVSQLEASMRACAVGGFLAYLPDLVVSASRWKSAVRRLAIAIAPPVPLYAVRRESLLATAPQDQLIAAVRHCLDSGARGRDRSEP